MPLFTGNATQAGHLNSNFPETKELWEQWFKLKEAAVQDYVAAVGLLAKVELNDTYHEGMREMDKAVMLANMGECHACCSKHGPVLGGYYCSWLNLGL